MSIRRTTPKLLLGAVLFAAIAGQPGCGYSEDEMQAKIREIDGLKSQLDAEQGRNRKTKSDLEEAKAQIEQLKQQLKAAGVDISKLNANLEEQSKALEDYRRRADQLEAIKKRFEMLREKLQALTKLGLNVTVRNNRMVIQLPGDVLFDLGKETLKKDGQDILLKVAEVVRNDQGLAQRSFQVAGHTDNAPLQGGRFKDNWGLSVMRAREVLAFLVSPNDKGGGGLNPERWSAAGYGDTDPIKPNDTPENKQANRRCELVVLPNVEEMLDLKTLATP
ncbi:OmpA family protein [Polyangium aurulentum]|uniref:OmpA family protein n=1 Tax=Polyangium aurulentum TaxID=2567896 RepID=UPI0010ADB48C|nr:OmpA family protein [Polyangium aurulentum]UQA62127.1 OmpA family protein [Polyangium aurulentum]